MKLSLGVFLFDRLRQDLFDFLLGEDMLLEWDANAVLRRNKLEKGRRHLGGKQRALFFVFHSLFVNAKRFLVNPIVGFLHVTSVSGVR